MAQLPNELAYEDNFFKAEWRVNGLWSAMLFQLTANQAAQIRWQISPEAYPQPTDTQGFMADLLVQQVVTNQATHKNELSQPVIAYEGKGYPVAGGADWVAVRKQLENWFHAQSATNHHPCWAIGAIGNGIKFWMYTQSIAYNGNNSPTNSRMVPFGWVNGAIHSDWNQAGNTADNGTSYGYGRAEVARIIAYMITHPWAQNMVVPALGVQW